MTHKTIYALSIIPNRLKAQLVLCFCFLFGCTFVQAQQDLMYSQYMNNMLNVNPAYAGNRTVNNVTALFRKQWVNVEGAPTTASLSWDCRQEDSRVGYGLQVYNDKIGVETSTGFQAFYSYHIPFERSSLIFGLSGGAMNFRGAYLTSTDPTQGGGIDPTFSQDINVLVPTAGVGALYSTTNWYVGLSAPSLLKTKVRNNDAQVVTIDNNRFFLTGGYIFDVSPILKLKPSAMLRSTSGTPLQYDINLNSWINNNVGLGVSYRSNDAIAGMVEFQIAPGITLGYAYDYLISNMKAYSSGSHELMLRFEFSKGKTQQVQSPRYY